MINIPATMRISLRALLAHKMRSFLTMLGIIIGVGAVIAMLGLGEGARKKIQEEISSVGSNLIIVLPGSITTGGMRMGAGTGVSLTMDDAMAIKAEAPAVEDVAPIFGAGATVVFGNQNWATTITGTTPGILIVRDWALSAGRSFNDQDVRGATKVCLIGQTVVDNLFGGIYPVGQVIRIKKIPFTVIGVLEKKGQSLTGQDQDDTIYVPITTAQKKLIGTRFHGSIRTIMVKARSAEELDRAEQQINDLLRQRHRIGPGKEDDFSVRNLTQMMQAAAESVKVMTIFLGIIASISLLVGGIGIMNIMLVSVTERTREIGIRMAVGAKTWDIRIQFLVEAMFLSLIGGSIGSLIGITSSVLLSKLAEIPPVVSVSSIVLAFGFSGAIGIFFGFYPAFKASRLNTIDALRYE
ncbi:MAG: ABC transporter permease [Thermodesulfovibrionales bacterium]|jgi:putative ABC transport system permease protein